MANSKVTLKSSEKHAIEVSKEFYETLRLIGPLHTIQVLKKARTPSVFKSDLKLVAKAVCRSFLINEDFLFSDARKYPKKQAFGTWCYLGFHEMKFPLKDLLIYADSNESSVSQAKKCIIDLMKKKPESLSAFDNKILKKIDSSRIFLNELIQQLIEDDKITEDKIKTKEKENAKKKQKK